MPTLDLGPLNTIPFQMNNLWEFYFLDLPPALKSLKSGDLFSNINNIATKILGAGLGITYYKYLVQEVTFNPLVNVGWTIDPATKKQYPTEAEQITDVSINFIETQQFSVTSFIKGLKERIYSQENKYFQKGDPSFMGILVFYKSAISQYNEINNALTNTFDFVESIDEKSKAFRTGQVFVFPNMFIKNSNDISATYTGSDKLTISTTFGVDQVLSLGTSGFLNLLRTSVSTTNFVSSYF